MNLDDALSRGLLCFMYIDEKKSVNDISKEFRKKYNINVSSETIRQRLIKYDIPMRNRNEAMIAALRRKHGIADQ